MIVIYENIPCVKYTRRHIRTCKEFCCKHMLRPWLKSRALGHGDTAKFIIQAPFYIKSIRASRAYSYVGFMTMQRFPWRLPFMFQWLAASYTFFYTTNLCSAAGCSNKLFWSRKMYLFICSIYSTHFGPTITKDVMHLNVKVIWLQPFVYCKLRSHAIFAHCTLWLIL